MKTALSTILALCLVPYCKKYSLAMIHVELLYACSFTCMASAESWSYIYPSVIAVLISPVAA